MTICKKRSWQKQRKVFYVLLNFCSFFSQRWWICCNYHVIDMMSYKAQKIVLTVKSSRFWIGRAIGSWTIALSLRTLWKWDIKFHIFPQAFAESEKRAVWSKQTSVGDERVAQCLRSDYRLDTNHRALRRHFIDPWCKLLYTQRYWSCLHKTSV